MKLFLRKNAKLSSAGGSAPRPPCIWRLEALPPNPQPPAAGGFAPRLPLASGGWGLSPQTPKTAPPLRISGYAPGRGHGTMNPDCAIVRNIEHFYNHVKRTAVKEQ